MKICVIGYGVVGKAIVAGLDKSDELDYDIVDPAYKEYNQDLKEVMESCDSAIICVPTPQDEDGYLDDSQVFDIVETIGYEKPILIKSTIAIDSCVYFRDSNRNVCFSPEFLRAETAVEDFLSETKLIIGGDMEQAQGWANVFGLCQPIKDEAFIDIVEAGIVKHAENAFLAMRVTFFNEIYKLVQHLGTPDTKGIKRKEIREPWMHEGVTVISGTVGRMPMELDYDSIVYALGLDDRIGHSHNQVPGPDGKFGWGGHCLPKDVDSLLAFAKDYGTAMPLIDSIVQINKIDRK